MAKNEQPLVSVGLPIYNAGEQTRRILDNLTSQDYSNIEIIISDNASTDQTQEICQEYAARDNRIRLFQNPANRGYMYNFDRVFQLSKGVYFMWAAHDDHWDTKFISSCVASLESHPEAIMSYTDQLHIHEQTLEQKTYDYAALNLAHPKRTRRIRNLLTFRPRPHAIMYGMYRREAIHPILPMPPVPSADITFLFRAMLIGPAVRVPEVLYERNVTHGVDFRSRMQMLRPGEKLPPNFVIVLQALYVLLNSVWYSPDTVIEKMKMSYFTLTYIFSSYGLQFIPPSLQPTVRNLKQSLIKS